MSANKARRLKMTSPISLAPVTHEHTHCIYDHSTLSHDHSTLSHDHSTLSHGSTLLHDYNTSSNYKSKF